MTTMAPKLPLLLLLPFLLLSSAAGHNVTKILSQFPEFSSLSSLITESQLAGDINNHQTITLLAVSNSALLSAANLPADVLKKILSLHVILDYYDASKLSHLEGESTIVTTLFQASGLATGKYGFLNVTDTGNGQVVFGSAVPGSPLDAKFVKVVATQPYNISVVEISSVIVPPGMAGDKSNNTMAPTPSATPPAMPPTSSSTSPSPSVMESPPPSHSKSPPPAAATTPAQAPATSSPAPADEGLVPGGPTEPPVSEDAPVSSPPAPVAADPPTLTGTADAPGPATGSEGSSPSAADRVVAGAGLAVAIGAAFLGDL